MKKKVIGVLLVLVLALGVGGFVYINDYYHAGEEAMAVMGSAETDEVIVSQKDGMAVFLPRGGSDTGIIFYPGGKVEYSASLCTAVVPLCRERHYLCAARDAGQFGCIGSQCGRRYSGALYPCA